MPTQRVETRQAGRCSKGGGYGLWLEWGWHGREIVDGAAEGRTGTGIRVGGLHADELKRLAARRREVAFGGGGCCLATCSRYVEQSLTSVSLSTVC